MLGWEISLRTVAAREVYRNIVSQWSRACLFGDEATLERSILIAASGRDDLWSKDVECLRVELPLAVHDRAQNRHPADVAVVKDLDNLGSLVAKAEIGLIEHQRSAEGIERVEDWRDGRGTACEGWLIAERTNCEERSRLRCPEIAMKSKLRQVIESVIVPAQQHVMTRNLLERRAEIGIAMDEIDGLRGELLLASICKG